MTSRQNISGGAPWEAIVGYSRAVKVGSMVFVAGTTAVDESGNVLHPGEGYGQTIAILRLIETALATAGATMNDVVRTRMFVTDVKQWEAIGRAHGEYFRDVRPAATLVEVSGLMRPGMVIEIEVDAVLTNS